MTKMIVNLTLSIATETIDTLLQTYPQTPHRELFADPDLYQSLLTYVLSRIPNHYMVIEQSNHNVHHKGRKIHNGYHTQLRVENQPASADQPADDAALPPPPTLVQEDLANIIHQGIHDLLAQHPERLHRPYPCRDAVVLRPSYWFG